MGTTINLEEETEKLAYDIALKALDEQSPSAPVSLKRTAFHNNKWTRGNNSFRAAIAPEFYPTNFHSFSNMNRNSICTSTPNNYLQYKRWSSYGDDLEISDESSPIILRHNSRITNLSNQSNKDFWSKYSCGTEHNHGFQFERKLTNKIMTKSETIEENVHNSSFNKDKRINDFHLINNGGNNMDKLRNGEQLHQQQQQGDFSLLNRNYRKKGCAFCRKNGESPHIYLLHSLYEDGKISCPILQKCQCNICGQKGHTMSHCPQKRAQSQYSVLKMINRFNMMKM